jgi:hypothetical protein
MYLTWLYHGASMVWYPPPPMMEGGGGCVKYVMMECWVSTIWRCWIWLPSEGVECMVSITGGTVECVPDGIYWVSKEWEGWLCAYGIVECGYLVKVLNVYLMECWVCTKLECWVWVPSRDVEYVYQVKCWLCTGWECCNVLRRVLWYCPFKNLNMESCVLLFLTMASGGVECCFFSLPPPPHTRPQLYILSTMTVYR